MATRHFIVIGAAAAASSNSIGRFRLGVRRHSESDGIARRQIRHEIRRLATLSDCMNAALIAILRTCC